MDARRIPVILCAGLALTLGGCFETRTTPTYHKSQPEPLQPGADAAVIVADDGPPSPPADDVELVGQTVQGYIQRVDGVAQRVERAGLADWPEPGDVPLAAWGPGGSAERPESLGDAPRTEGEPVGKPQVAGAEDASDVSPTAQRQLEPPVLGAVSVRARPTIALPAAGDGELTGPAAANTATIARNAPVSLERFLAQWPGSLDDASFRRQLDFRVLRVIAGDYEGAREPLDMVSAEQQALAERFIASLIAIRQAHDGDMSEAATQVLHELNELEASLRPLSELHIPTLAICQEVRGYGDYEPIEPATFANGYASEFVLYCELRDFVSDRGNDGFYRAQFEMRTTILSRSGESVLVIRDADVVDRCRQRRHDCFIPRLVRLPATLSPGEYVVKVTVIDKLGDKLAESRASFRVVASP